MNTQKVKKCIEDEEDGFLYTAWPESYQATNSGSICALVKDKHKTLTVITYKRGDSAFKVWEKLEYECIKRPNEKSKKEYI